MTTVIPLRLDEIPAWIAVAIAAAFAPVNAVVLAEAAVVWMVAEICATVPVTPVFTVSSNPVLAIPAVICAPVLLVCASKEEPGNSDEGANRIAAEVAPTFCVNVVMLSLAAAAT